MEPRRAEPARSGGAGGGDGGGGREIRATSGGHRKPTRLGLGITSCLLSQ